MDSLKYVFYAVLIAATLSYCSDSSTDSGGDDTSQVTLSTSVNPSGAGSVNPSSGTFDEGTEISVEALPDDGWEFVDWSGTISSTDNPLTFNISQDTDLTANFNATSSAYRMDMTVSDSLNTMDDLRFGQTSSATNGYDSNVDFEAPPPPPSGELHAFFKIPSRDLFWDMRDSEANSLTWNLQYQIGAGDSLRFSWSITELTNGLNGTLSLESPDGSIQVDMTSQASLDMPVNAADSLLIKYKFSN